MISHFPSPILSVAADVVKDLEGEDALYGLWALFTKCKESLKDGRRLENISWRLWYREMASAQSTPSSSPGSLSPSFSEKRSPSPITPVSEDGLITPQVPLPHPSRSPANDIATAHSWHAQHSATTVITAGRRLSTASAPIERAKSHSSVSIGKMILDILPCKLDVNSQKSAHATTVPRIVQPRPIVAVVPTVQLPTTPPPSNGLSFPRVVVVNPTPHPTPPATPSISHPPTTAAQPSTHLLPPPPARSLVSSTIVAVPSAGSTKPPSPPKGASALQPKQPMAASLLTSTKPLSHDAVPTGPSKSKRYNDDTLKASDRRFFLQDPGSPSPDAGDRATTSETRSENGDQGQEREDHSPSSGTSSHLKSELAGHTSAAGVGAKRPRALQVRRSKDRHVPVRPAFQRMQSHGARQASQKKAAAAAAVAAAGADSTKKSAFNIGSVSSNGSRSGRSTKAEKDIEKEKEKEKKPEPSRARASSPAALAAAKPPASARPTTASTAANPATSKNATTSTNGAGPSQQRRGIVISTSSEYETTDSDDDSEWASEDSAEDGEKQAKAKAAEEARRREEEEQRERDMFAKVPKRSYSNLNRTKSGLSQLLNPDPNIFPPNHPYRSTRSTQDMTQFARQAAAGSVLPTSRSSAAVPLAAQVTVQAAPVVRPPDNTSTRQGAYRPRGPPQEADMDTESEEENPEDTIQVSHSLAQQKLAALAGRRHSDHGPAHTQAQAPTQAQMQAQRQRQRQPPSGLQQQRQQMETSGRTPLPTVATAPIPLTHPYNLPAPAPPMTPRTTRRQMLQTELSESLRRNLLWERQVSRINMTGRRAGVLGGSGLRPLTTMNGEGFAAVQQQAAAAQGPNHQQPQANGNGDDREERRRLAMARNRSWADEYHYSGW